MHTQFLQKALNFYTVESKDKNFFTPYIKKIKLYSWSVKKAWEIRFLPTQPYVYPAQERMKLEPTLDFQYKWTLDDRQNKVADIINRRALEYKYYCGLIDMKTGTGKSHMIMWLTKYIGKSTLILVHNKKTLQEMVQKCTEYMWEEPGVYFWDEKRINPFITICTHDSFVQCNGHIGMEFNLILYDEADVNLSDKMIKALCNSQAMAMYGFTGTPYRQDLDTADMEKVFGKLIRVDQDTDGYKMLPTLHMFRYTPPKRYEFSSFPELKDIMIADKDRLHQQMDIVIEYMKTRNFGLILTERLEEAKTYLNELGGRWNYFNVVYINGETKMKDDSNAISIAMNDLSKKTIIIGTIWKMARWVDIPTIDTVFLFSAVHFKWTVVQAIGRWLRTHSNKKDMLLIDFSDSAINNQYYSRCKAYTGEYGIQKQDMLIYKITKDSHVWTIISKWSQANWGQS